ncbi:MAG: RND transporter [Halothiobacillus sp. 24-54-40]|nr:efflux transporter outer membrane subunit [Halothiobacillaceae bacterium]OYV46182.1 MAG: RND transporter [Halothiobacillus sp. 20-53-49]OYY41416.1 MAG: RND transporter [Halothiobacillus sp. 35-54-62]OYY55576.1 MAG: RND transporter [Halothiobacillus sp. 28-55-5]OYZ87870.1 MAG: RND transporter [Halothiobacillus sp. 24-54-40]OZA80640.1 MAG: RND transporter [Halothiobacillus sp. 39-53-45]HUM99804.1 efflux transporter outer membrane subunit [Halothiobacillus sp.]
MLRLFSPPRPRIGSLALGLALSVMVAGCTTVGPNYEAPKLPMPSDWQSTQPLAALPASLPDQSLRLARWWQVFDDAQLTQLIDQALANNKDIQQAEGRLQESRARRAIAGADLFPVVGARAAANRTGGSSEAGLGLTNNVFSSGFDASWEADIFGGKRRAREAASAQVQASEADLADVQVSLTAEVGLNYLNLRAYETRLLVARSNLQIQTETRDIAHWRQLAGLTTQLDVDQATATLEQTRAQIPPLETLIAQTKHQIAFLLGLNPDQGPALTPAPMPKTTATLAIGIPAELLRRRPDIRRAERQLAAQTAQVGVATAAQYPNFSLSGSVGLAALAAGNLLTAGAQTFALGSNAAWTAFDAGRIRQNIVVQNALQAQALGRYEATVLTALLQVENALTAYAREQERQAALINAVQAAQSAERLARNQYAAGLVSFQTVLDTQRSLLTLQDQKVSSAAAVSTDLVQLYKALGGGWATNTPVPPQTQTPSALEHPTP